METPSPALERRAAGPEHHAEHGTEQGEPCWRCAARMEWRHGTWQCPKCRFKIGCCEGPTAECFPDR